MSIRQKEIYPGENSPYQNCKLGRARYGNILTEIVSTYSDGFVLALDNKWGTGKTTFIRMWQKQLDISGFKTVLFNAWEHDYQDKPLPAILGELKSLIKNEEGELHRKFAELLKHARKLANKVLPSAAKAIAKQFGLDEPLQEITKDATEGLSDLLDEEIEDYINKKKSLITFKTALSDYATSLNENKPLIFIIDELDRCRPDYSVQVLEQIKHFFSVPGIVFVLAIDKEQLCNAIRGYYGTDLIDADEYLKRFVDLEYTLPQPDIKTYCTFLSEQLQLGAFFNHPDRVARLGSTNEMENFNDFASSLFLALNLSLRQVEKIYSGISVLLKRTDNRSYIYSELLIFLFYCRVHHKSFFTDFMTLKIETQDINKRFLEIIPKGRNHDSNRTYLNVFVNLLYLNESMRTIRAINSLVSVDENQLPISNYPNNLGYSDNELGREIIDLKERYPYLSKHHQRLFDSISIFSNIQG